MSINPKRWYVYIMTNQHNTTLYTGVTNDILRRLQEHNAGKGGSFTKKYNVKKLVWMQHFSSPEQAIATEKKIKGGSRAKKIRLIEEYNPEWLDLEVESPDDYL